MLLNPIDVMESHNTSSTSIEDFKYFNVRLQILELNTYNTSKSTQTTLVMTSVKTIFVLSTFVHTTFVPVHCNAYINSYLSDFN